MYTCLESMKKILGTIACLLWVCSCQVINNQFLINQENIKNICILVDEHPTLPAQFAATEFQFQTVVKKVEMTSRYRLGGNISAAIRRPARCALPATAEKSSG